MAYKFYLSGERIQTIFLDSDEFTPDFNNKENNKLIVNSFSYDAETKELSINAKIVNLKLPNYYLNNYDFYLVPIFYNELSEGLVTNNNLKNKKHRQTRKAGLPPHTEDKVRIHTSARKYGVTGRVFINNFKITDFNNINITMNAEGAGRTCNYLEYTYLNYHKKPNNNYYYQIIGFYLGLRPQDNAAMSPFYIKEFKNQFRIEYIFLEI